MTSQHKISPTISGGAFSFARPNASEKLRLEILAAAAHAFFEDGFYHTSVDEIADRLGASKGQVYHYYRSKSDILFDIQQYTTEWYLDAVAPIANCGHPCDERIWLMARQHALMTVTNVTFARVTLFAAGVHNYKNEAQQRAHRAISVRRKEYENLFASAITEGVSNGVFRNVKPSLATKALLGVLNWVAYWYSPGSDTPEEQEAISIEFANYVVSGLGDSVRVPFPTDHRCQVSGGSPPSVPTSQP